MDASWNLEDEHSEPLHIAWFGAYAGLGIVLFSVSRVFLPLALQCAVSVLVMGMEPFVSSYINTGSLKNARTVLSWKYALYETGFAALLAGICYAGEHGIANLLAFLSLATLGLIFFMANAFTPIIRPR